MLLLFEFFLQMEEGNMHHCVTSYFFEEMKVKRMDTARKLRENVNELPFHNFLKILTHVFRNRTTSIIL